MIVREVGGGMGRSMIVIAVTVMMVVVTTKRRVGFDMRGYKRREGNKSDGTYLDSSVKLFVDPFVLCVGGFNCFDRRQVRSPVVKEFRSIRYCLLFRRTLFVKS